MRPYYFIEGDVVPWILEWQKIRETDLNRAKILLTLIMEQTYKIIKGVIFKHGYQKREKYEILFSHAMEACMKALQRFDINKGSAFDYLSLTAKKSIIYYLIKRKRKIVYSLNYTLFGDESMEVINSIESENKKVRDLDIENLTDSIFSIIINDKTASNQYGQSAKEKILSLAKELRLFLYFTQGQYNKKEFYRWCRCQGVNSNILRKFVKLLKENSKNLSTETGVYDD